MGHSEEKEDSWGNTYTVHYDDGGNEIGRTETHEPDFFESLFRGSTESYEKHYDADDNYTGRTESHEPDFFESVARGSTESYDRHYDADGCIKKGATSSSQSRSGASTSKSTSSSGKSHRLSGGGLRYSGDTFGLVLGLLMLAGVIAYVVWVIVTMNSGGPETLGEFLLILPGVLAIIYVGIQVGIVLIGIALAIGAIVLIFRVAFGV